MFAFYKSKVVRNNAFEFLKTLKVLTVRWHCNAIARPALISASKLVRHTAFEFFKTLKVLTVRWYYSAIARPTFIRACRAIAISASKRWPCDRIIILPHGQHFKRFKKLERIMSYKFGFYKMRTQNVKSMY